MQKVEDIDRYITKKEIYNEDYMKEYVFGNNINTFFVKASMGLGKTKMLKSLFNKYYDKKIVIVSFRITLDKEYVNNFDNFMLYSDINNSTYDTDEYNRMVIQVDSFYKVRGKIDLLVLDEFTYTATHLVDRVKNKEAVYNTLLEYIRDLNNKIIIMDALIDFYTVEWFYHQKRKIHYIENKFKKHKEKKIYNYSNKVGVFIDNIIKNISENKKIVIPTNSKNFLYNLELKIKAKLPHIKCKFLDADNSDDINLDNWNLYDIVGYTPTIVAGISYEKFHFDKCFAYFVNSSSPAEMALQQLFRVRNISDNEVHICVEKKDNITYPTKVCDIEDYILDKNKCMVDGVLGVRLSRINKTIIKDSYYYLYRNCQIKLFRSKNNYESRLINLLKQQGIDNINYIKENNIEKDKIARKELKKTSTLCKDSQIKDIVLSNEMDDDEYYLLKNKTNLTYIDKNRIKKKKFRVVYNYEGNISIELYKKYNNKYSQYKNVNTCYNLKDELINYLKNNIEKIEKTKLEKTEMVDKEPIDGSFKLLTANTYILHQNKNYEKFLLGLEILSVMGIDSIFNKNIVNVNFSNIYNYIKNKEYIIRLLFKCKQFDINMINNNEKGMNEMIKYLNSRLRTLFNIYIKKDNKENNYKIINIDYWCDEINPLKENEMLKIELMIENMFKDSDITELDI